MDNTRYIVYIVGTILAVILGTLVFIAKRYEKQQEQKNRNNNKQLDKDLLTKYQNQVLFDLYKKYNIKSDFSLSQFGLYLLKIPGITKLKSSKIWSKQINCKLVQCWLNTKFKL